MPTSDVRTSRPTVHSQWKKGVKAKTTNMYGVDLSSYAELVEDWDLYEVTTNTTTTTISADAMVTENPGWNESSKMIPGNMTGDANEADEAWFYEVLRFIAQCSNDYAGLVCVFLLVVVIILVGVILNREPRKQEIAREGQA